MCVVAECLMMLQIEDLVVVNLDEGVIGCPESLEIVTLPKQPVAAFTEAVTNLRSRLDLWQLETYVQPI